MKTFTTILIGLICGFVIGMALTAFIGLFDFSLVHRSFGYQYLSYFCAMGGAVIGLIVMDKRKEK